MLTPFQVSFYLRLVGVDFFLYEFWGTIAGSLGGLLFRSTRSDAQATVSDLDESAHCGVCNFK